MRVRGWEVSTRLVLMAVDHINHVALRGSCVCVCVLLHLTAPINSISFLPLLPSFLRASPSPTTELCSPPPFFFLVCVMDCWEPNEVPPLLFGFLWLWSVCEGGRESQRWQVGYVLLTFAFQLSSAFSPSLFHTSSLWPSIFYLHSSFPHTLSLPLFLLLSSALPKPLFILPSCAPSPPSADSLPFICWRDWGLMIQSRLSTTETYTECCY